MKLTTERGEFATGDDGFALWFPTAGSGGLTAENLRTLATELDRLNAPWHEEVSSIDPRSKQRNDAFLQITKNIRALGRKQTRHMAEIAEHFWRDRDSWIQQSEHRTDEALGICEENLRLREQVAQLTQQLAEADKTAVENWGIDEENARLRKPLLVHLLGWGAVFETAPGTWLVLVSSETDKSAAVTQMESEIIHPIDPDRLKRVAVCPATHFDGAEPTAWSTCGKSPAEKGTPPCDGH